MAIVQYWIGTHGPFEYEDTDAEHDYPEQMARKQDVADGIVDPSDTVELGTSFGIASSAGTSDDFSRSDHQHGTPDDPLSDGLTTIVTVVIGPLITDTKVLTFTNGILTEVV